MPWDCTGMQIVPAADRWIESGLGKGAVFAQLCLGAGPAGHLARAAESGLRVSVPFYEGGAVGAAKEAGLLENSNLV